MSAVTSTGSVGLSVGAFALSGAALVGSALFALGILSPPSQVGGPGTSSQIGSLRTEGNLHVDRNASISGSLDVTGPTTMSSLSASGNAILNSVKLTGGLNSESTLTGTQFLSTVGNGHAPFVVNSSTLVNNLHASNADQLGGADPGFYVNTGSGAQTKSGALSVGSLVTGPLTASGVTNLGGPLSVGGLTTLSGNLRVPGSTTLGTAVVTGDTTVGGSLNVNGATNLALLNVINLAVANAAKIGGPLTVGGNTTLNGSLNVAGPTALANGLAITGNTSGGTATFTGLTINGPTNLNGPTNVTSGGLTVSGLASLNGGVTSTTGKFNTLAGTGAGTDLTLNPGGNLVLSPTGNLVIPNTVGNITLSAAGDLKTLGSLTATTNIQGVQLVSTATTGTPPLMVSSTTLVPNLHVATADTALTATSATTATTAINALNLGGQPPSAYIDTSMTGQSKLGLLTLTGGFTSSANSAVNANLDVSGVLHVTSPALSTIDKGLQVGTLHDLGILTVEGAAQFNGTLAVGGAPAAGYQLTVNGATKLIGDVGGGDKFAGLTTDCVRVASVETCPYQNGVTLASTPKSIIVTPVGDYEPAIRYWITLPAPTTTAFTVKFSSNPASAVQFYYVVVQ